MAACAGRGVKGMGSVDGWLVGGWVGVDMDAYRLPRLWRIGRLSRDKLSMVRPILGIIQKDQLQRPA